jgi:hypothetical protein
VYVNGTVDEDKMRRFKNECDHFSFNKCPIYTHDGASAKFNTNSHETDNNVVSQTCIQTCDQGVLRLFFKLFFMGVYICCMGVQTCDGVRTCFMGFKPFSWVFKPQALLSESCELVLNLALAPTERK